MSLRDQVLEILTEVRDPEIPVLNVVEMGIVRDVTSDEKGIQVSITPTYTGCPAMKTIADEIKRALSERGFGHVRVRQTFAEPWTTAWLSAEACEKLRKFGIAPPVSTGGADLPASLPCPFCGSEKTELRSAFGSTACKALYFCIECVQPFEAFKTI